MADPLSPTIARLRTFPQDNSRRNYPKGTRQPLTKELATRFCDLIANSTLSIPQLLTQNPGFPPAKTLESWRFRYPWFASLWLDARKRQADFLIQHCLELAHTVDPKTAHVVRVKFDIYRFVAAKFHPDLYGDKSNHPPQQTTVNVGISIPAERLSELRSKLSDTRNAFVAAPLTPISGPSTSQYESRTASNGTEQPKQDVTHQK